MGVVVEEGEEEEEEVEIEKVTTKAAREYMDPFDFDDDLDGFIGKVKRRRLGGN